MKTQLFCFKFLIIFISTSLLLFLEHNPLISKDKIEESIYEDEIIVTPPECLEYRGAGRGPGSSYQLIFYNSCPKRLYVNVCVEERPGKFRLHQSASKIPKFGRLNIFTHEGGAPLSVSWESGAGAPEVPEACLE